MASNKMDKLLVDELCSIAGVSRVVATNLLEACGNNLEMAVNMHMEGVVTDHGESSMQSYNCNSDGGEVRAPIPQRQEVLVEGPDELAYSFRGRRRVARSVFDKFRDFEAETKRQEELLGENSASDNSDKPCIPRKNKKRTLEDLFRPPLELMFRGSFQMAKDSAVSSKKWLMVNVQNSSEFPCQVLNRDVWSSTVVKNAIKKYFVFWQIYHDSEEGRRYMTFYPVNDWPYVSIIDPRTGECLIFWHRINADTFNELIQEFLSLHSTFDEQLNSPQANKKLKTSSSILEESEEFQLRAAIKESLENVNNSDKKKPLNGKPEGSSSDSDNDALETFDSESDIEFDSPVKQKEFNHVDATKKETDESEESTPIISPVKDWKFYLGLDSDPESKLILRFPDGKRDSISMPCTSKLMALVKYIETKGFSNESYELVTNFPKRQISCLDFNATLKEVNLFPQETIFIQKR